MEYQVYLIDEQKDYLKKYIHDKYYISIIIMRILAIVSILCLGLGIIAVQDTTFINAAAQEGILELFLSFLAFAGCFMEEFTRGFGKAFGRKCDIKCIEKDLYTLEYGNFGCREKDTGKHPYYICDNKGDTYVCPKFLDYKNADISDKFLYIKLNNGRGYAIGDHIYMK